MWEAFSEGFEHSVNTLSYSAPKSVLLMDRIHESVCFPRGKSGGSNPGPVRCPSCVYRIGARPGVIAKHKLFVSDTGKVS